MTSPGPASLMTPTLPAPCTAGQQPAVPRKKILVVDDDPVILRTLSLILKSRGYDVVTASEGSQAISAMRDAKPDLMLVDICFPPDVGSGGCVPWDGFLLIQWLRSIAGKIPAILITGADRPEYKERAAAAGAAALFRKPIDKDQLLASIEAALSGKNGSAPDARATVLAS